MLVMLPHDFKGMGLPRCAIWLQLGGEHTFSCWPFNSLCLLFNEILNERLCAFSCVPLLSQWAWVWLMVKHGTSLLFIFDH
jgi:hypothetical protein